MNKQPYTCYNLSFYKQADKSIFICRWVSQRIINNSFLKEIKFCTVFILLIFLFQYVNGQRTWDGGGDGVNWSSANNWTPNGVPTSTDAVTIMGGQTVNVDVTTAVCAAINLSPITNAIANLTFSSGSKLTASGIITLGQAGAANRRGNLNMTNSGTLVCQGIALANAGANTFTSGAGTIELTATNTLPASIFTSFNNLTISAGTTSAAVNIVIGGTLNLTSGTLDVKAFTVTSGELTGNGTLTNSSSAATFTSGSKNTDVTYSGTISGALALTKSGSARLTLTGANSYTGATSIDDGILNIQNANALGSTAGSSSVKAGATLELQGSITVGAEALTIDGEGNSSYGVIRNISGNNAWGGTLTLSSTGTNPKRTICASGTMTFTDVNLNDKTLLIAGTNGTIINGVISGSGIMRKDATGPLTLNNANTYTGGTTLNNGELIINNSQALGIGGTFSFNGGGLNNALSIDNTSGAPITLNNYPISFSTNGTLTFGGSNDLNLGSGNFTLSNSANAVTINTSAKILTIGGIISGVGYSLTKTGTGDLTLYGANTFNNGITLSAGKLNINNASALGSGTFTISSGTIIDNTSGGAITLSTNNVQLWNGDFTFTGTNNLNLGTGTVTISAGRQVTVSAGILTEGGIISGAGLALTKAGNGIFSLTASCTYTGLTTVSAGVLQLNKTGGGTLPSTNAVTINGTGTLQTNTNQTIGNLTMTTGTGTLLVSSGIAQTITGTYAVTSGTINNQGTIKLNGGAMSFPGTTVNNGTANTMTSLEVASSATVTSTASYNIAANLSITSGILEIGSYSINRSTSGGSLTISNGASLKIGGTGTVPANYATHAVGSTSTIEYNGTNQSITVLNSSQSYGHLIMSGSGIKTLDGNITIVGNWTRNTGPTFNSNDKSVTFTGATKSVIIAPNLSFRDTTGSFGGETFSYLYINKTNTTDSVLFQSNIAITKQIGFVKGRINLGDSNVLIASNKYRTADVDIVTTPANVNLSYSGAGRFIIQRYVPSSTRTWRLLTVPIRSGSGQTLKAAFQEGMSSIDKTNPGVTNPWPGYGTHLTNLNGTAVNGFDQGTNTASIRYWTGTGWGVPASTTGISTTDYPGYMMFIRGSRAIAIDGPTVQADTTTLEPKGKLFIGDTTINRVTTIQVVGNPYASRINMKDVVMDGGTFGLNIGKEYTLWVPNLESIATSGKFITYSSTGANTDASFSGFDVPVVVPNSPDPGVIESGMAMILKGFTSSITFHETDKRPLTSSNKGIQNRPVVSATNPVSRLYTVLYTYVNGYPKIADGTLNSYNEIYHDEVDNQDAGKFNSILAEGLSIIKVSGTDTALLCIERKQKINAGDTIFLNLMALKKSSNYRLGLAPLNMYYTFNGIATLIDRQGQIPPMNISLANGDTSFVNFTTGSNDPANNYRFMIVFRQAPVLPVNFCNIKAAPKNTFVEVEWKVENEVDIISYDVESSVDGIHFTKEYTVRSEGNSLPVTYRWLDQSPATSKNSFYRIVLADRSGSLLYSPVVIVKIALTLSSIEVYPNPIKDNYLNLQFNDQEKGKYNVSIYNLKGQMLFETALSEQGGSWSESVQLKKILSAGEYLIEIKGAEKKIVKRIVVIR